MSSHASQDAKHMSGKHLAALALGAVGVVYGDIGTSPLYTMKEVFFNKAHAIAYTEANVLGLLSLIFWVLTIVVAIKYALVILRADNQGEGGTMVLLAMALRTASNAKRRRWLTLLGIFGVSLFFGDSIVTPAVSVLGAMEGLKEINEDWLVAVVPVTVVILIGLFYVQRTGTGKVSAWFGPIMVLWFVVLGGLGIFHIASNPRVFFALNPWYALAFLAHNPGLFIVVLGSAVLAVTGAEALYADMGHFGRKPIRVAWFVFDADAGAQLLRAGRADSEDLR